MMGHDHQRSQEGGKSRRFPTPLPPPPPKEIKNKFRFFWVFFCNFFSMEWLFATFYSYGGPFSPCEVLFATFFLYLGGLFLGENFCGVHAHYYGGITLRNLASCTTWNFKISEHIGNILRFHCMINSMELKDNSSLLKTNNYISRMGVGGGGGGDCAINENYLNKIRSHQITIPNGVARSKIYFQFQICSEF